MATAGRKPMGPKLVEHLSGSERAKGRLEVILETLTGTLPIGRACAELGIGEARFYQLRNEVLQAGLARLEPRPAGRPARLARPERAVITNLQQQVEELGVELNTAQVRLEIAQTLPHLLREEAVKKTAQRKHRRKKLHAKGRRKPR